MYLCMIVLKMERDHDYYACMDISETNSRGDHDYAQGVSNI